MINNMIVVIIILIMMIIALPGYATLYQELRLTWSRYKIGREESFELWKKKVSQVTFKWINNMPRVPIHSTSRLNYFTIIRTQSSEKVQSWQMGGLLLGAFSEIEEDEDVQRVISSFIDSEGHWKLTYKTVDSVIIAYAILSNTSKADAIYPAMNDTYTMIKDYLGKDGTVAYTDKNDSKRYVDTIGMICPFLVTYANVYSDCDAKKLAIKQLEKYELNGFIDGCPLPFHGYDIKTREPIGLIGWGRGLGWYLLGLIDSIDLEESMRSSFEVKINEMSKSLRRYCKEDGGYGSVIQYDATYDSSTTAIVGYFYAKCYRLFGCKYDLDIALACLRKLMTVTRRNGIIDYSQGDTPSLGVYSTRLDEMPFTQGIALRLANMIKDDV